MALPYPSHTPCSLTAIISNNPLRLLFLLQGAAVVQTQKMYGHALARHIMNQKNKRTYAVPNAAICVTASPNLVSFRQISRRSPPRLF